MSNISIGVEFLAGTDITQAIDEAKQKARQWDVAYVTFSFNGVKMSVGPNANIANGVERFHTELRKPDNKSAYVIENGQHWK